MADTRKPDRDRRCCADVDDVQREANERAGEQALEWDMEATVYEWAAARWLGIDEETLERYAASARSIDRPDEREAE